MHASATRPAAHLQLGPSKACLAVIIRRAPSYQLGNVMAIKGLASATRHDVTIGTVIRHRTSSYTAVESISTRFHTRHGSTLVQQPLAVVMAKVDAEIFTEGADATRDRVQVL